MLQNYYNGENYYEILVKVTALHCVTVEFALETIRVLQSKYKYDRYPEGERRIRGDINQEVVKGVKEFPFE